MEITHNSKKKRKTTKTGKRYNIYVIRQQQYNSFTKNKSYFDGHLEVYDVLPAKLVTWDDSGAPWADGNAWELCHRHPTSNDMLGFSNIATF